MQGEIVKFGKSIGNLKISFVVIEKYKKFSFWKLRKISKKWEFLTQKWLNIEFTLYYQSMQREILKLYESDINWAKRTVLKGKNQVFKFWN